jgi:signal transduction histidine kinase/ActR/RegA family two-component response regulator
LLAEVVERRRAEQDLQELNESLDRLVVDRTQALRQLEAELREADRRKDEFIATLAHELRNPLAPIRNATQLLQRKDADSTGAQRARDIIARQVRIMSRLLDDLMDVSRINRGRLELQRERANLSSVIELAVESSRTYLNEGGHEFTLSLSETPVFLDADVTRLSQVFVNLLANAAKYTDRGGHVQLTVQREGSEVRIAVKDDGIGIPADQLRSVFGMFAQVDGASARSRGGLGIGLSLVKYLVELHGGHVEAQSPGPGAGSTFTVSLPLPPARPLAAGELFAEQAGEVAAGKSLKVLVVDDNHDGAETLSELLLLLEHDVRLVHDGEAALVEAASFRPDVVLLDIGLPGMSGYDVCSLLRRSPGGDRVAIVALTGWGDKEAQRRSKEAGFDRHLVKPVDEATLIEALSVTRDSPASP